MTMLQVRRLSEQTHDTLRARAAQAGQSLSDYVAAALDEMVSQPTMAEFLARLDTREPINPSESAVFALAQERANRP
ncbi:MAG: hypothetical protein LBV30_05085 [Propionibacteriaceae bacterium]|jgi:plasmid stability protein|nr:hypothetical protein [Propionibacteriaceae bacterium]